MTSTTNIDPFLSGKVIQVSDTERLLIPSLSEGSVRSTKPYIVQEDDTILTIAATQFNGNVSMWYVIYLINDFEDPLDLPIGEIIKLPAW